MTVNSRKARRQCVEDTRRPDLLPLSRRSKQHLRNGLSGCAFLIAIGMPHAALSSDDPVHRTAVLQYLQEGSFLRIAGVNVLEVGGSRHLGMARAGAVTGNALLRSADDLPVVQPPSRWTRLHPMWMVASLGALLLVVISCNRIQRWKMQSSLDERERLAGEMHDTLAQSFAGIGFQLEAIGKEIPDGFPRLRQQVDLARALVRHSHKEARRRMEPMEPEPLGADGLVKALEASARKMVEGGSVQVIAVTSGEPLALPPQIAASLLRIGQEAIANAVRHADPSRLEIALGFEPRAIRLAIADNGGGFVKSGELLGFGLRGMRKRSAAISAKLEIVSHPGQGTRIEVVAPLPPAATIATRTKQAFNYLAGRILHVEP